MAGAQIPFYKNDGSGANSTYSSTNSSFPAINYFGWSRDGYDFLYWNTASDRSGDTYYAGDPLPSGIGESISFYAIWEPHDVIIKHYSTRISWSKDRMYFLKSEIDNALKKSACILKVEVLDNSSNIKLIYCFYLGKINSSKFYYYCPNTSNINYGVVASENSFKWRGTNYTYSESDGYYYHDVSGEPE